MLVQLLYMVYSFFLIVKQNNGIISKNELNQNWAPTHFLILFKFYS